MTKLTRVLGGLALAFTLSTATFAHCLDHVDGLASSGTKTLVKDQQGNWGYKLNSGFNSNFEFQVRKEFALADGSKALVVVLYAPGYDPECELDVVKESDVVLYNGKLCAGK